MITHQIAKLVATLVMDDKGFKDKAKENKKASSDLFGTLKQGAVVAGTVAAAFAVMKKGFDLGREGAQIDLVRTRFDRLAESVGTTSEALMKDLKQATRGLYSDAELMQSATDFMALGLANTHDEAVRLAAVSAGLNMNMNQLVLTLTNMTTMRFDALGVKVDGFKEKVKELEEQGYSTDAAFKEAFLQQAEEQLETVGHAADTTAGEFMKLEAASKNATDRLKEQWAEFLLPMVKGINDWNDASEERIRILGKVAEAEGLTIEQLRRALGMAGEAEEHYQKLVDEYIRAEQYGLAWERVLGTQSTAIRQSAEDVEALTKKNEDYLSLVGRLTTEIEDNEEKHRDLKKEEAELLAEKKKLLEQGWSPYSEKVADVTKKLDENAEAQRELADDVEEATHRMVLSMLQQMLAADGLNEAEMNFLLEQGRQWGIYSNAAVREAQRAINKANDLKDAFNSLPTERTMTVRVLVNQGVPASVANQIVNQQAQSIGLHAGGGGRAVGGPVVAGRSYDVAEFSKPEVFTPNTSGRVDPVKETAVSVDIDYQRLARLFAQELVKARS